MHPALRKGPLFTKNTPISHFLQKKPISFLAYGPAYPGPNSERKCAENYNKSFIINQFKKINLLCHLMTQ